VQAEVVVAGTAEQDVGVALELTLAQHGEAKFSQRGFIHPTAGG
jgi:hypothetical protein